MIIRKRFLFKGTVQGVGFRPFHLAAGQGERPGRLRPEPLRRRHRRGGGSRRGRRGLSRNRSGASSRPWRRSPGSARRRSRPRARTRSSSPKARANAPGDLHITPDIATCDACLAELFDPADRRFRYPFINCTDCGPRLTIINAVPYDRSRTSMACFPMCPTCRKEYENPADRRFHAEPNACPDCGPRLELLDGDGRSLRRAIPSPGPSISSGRGSILAVKGLGGFHLCVDAQNDAAVQELRSRKFREEKPLAVMVRDIDSRLPSDRDRRGRKAPPPLAGATHRPDAAPGRGARLPSRRPRNGHAGDHAPLHPAPAPPAGRRPSGPRHDERQPDRRADLHRQPGGPPAARRGSPTPFSSTTGTSSCAATTRWPWPWRRRPFCCAAPGGTPPDPSPCGNPIRRSWPWGPSSRNTLCILKGTSPF